MSNKYMLMKHFFMLNQSYFFAFSEKNKKQILIN